MAEDNPFSLKTAHFHHTAYAAVRVMLIDDGWLEVDSAQWVGYVTELDLPVKTIYEGESRPHRFIDPIRAKALRNYIACVAPGAKRP